METYENTWAQFQASIPYGPFHLTSTAMPFASTLPVVAFGGWNPRWAMERDTTIALAMIALILGKHLALTWHCIH